MKTNALTKILNHACEHSIIHKYAFVLSNGTDTFYTDTDELVSRYTDTGYNVIAEYYEGYKMISVA